MKGGLGELFDRSLQLTPAASPVKSSASPSKRFVGASNEDEQNDTSIIRPEESARRHRREETSRAAGSRADGTGTPAGRSTRKKYNPLKDMTVEEIEKLASPSVKRLKDVAHLCKFLYAGDSYFMADEVPDFYDYYYNLVTYVHERQQRTEQWREASRELRPDENLIQWKKFAGRERVALRKRRTRLRKGDFHLLTQVGQGGYGQVYLAEHNETKEVCALKVMSKKLLFKLDEIRHVLTERDILTAAKSEWLVKLLYAFQDDENIYLAMVKTSSSPVLGQC